MKSPSNPCLPVAALDHRADYCPHDYSRSLAMECPECRGRGSVPDFDYPHRRVPCPVCEGRQEVRRCDYECEGAA